MAQDQESRLHAEGRQGRPIRLVTAAHMEAGRRSVRTEPTIAKRCPLNFEEARSQWEVEKKKFLGANFGCLRDVSPAVLKAFRAALSEAPEEAIQKVITANPYLIQYAVARSGHQGIWVYPLRNRVCCRGIDSCVVGDRRPTLRCVLSASVLIGADGSREPSETRHP